jgi:RimJ/RimL family protein N-acetyltransferase
MSSEEVRNIQLSTERLKFRLVQISDLGAIHDLHSFPEVDEFNTLGIPKDIIETKEIVEALITDVQCQDIKDYTFIIEQLLNNEFVGLIALKLGGVKSKSAEVWFKLHPDQWAKGFGTEALSKIIDFGFIDLGLHRLEAGCAVENIGSAKVLEKAGMTREGAKRKSLPLKTGWADNYEYAILDTDRG